MKNFSADLDDLLANVPKESIFRVTLFAIGPTANGQFIYATNGSDPITFNGNTYDPLEYGMWSRGDITTKVGLESNTCDLTVLADNYEPVYFPGMSGLLLFMDGLKAGLLDQAGVSIYTAYMETYGVVVGPTGGSLVETAFVGEIGEWTKIGLTKAENTANDLLYLLNAQVPQQLIQASCGWTLYSLGCTLSKANFTKSGAVQAVPTNLSIAAAHIPTVSPAGTWMQGTLTWTSGNNQGLSQTISGWTPGTTDTFTFDVPPLLPVQMGDAFTVAQGCNKSLVSCNDLQPSTALVNFSGCPEIPVPESAI